MALERRRAELEAKRAKLKELREQNAIRRAQGKQVNGEAAGFDTKDGNHVVKRSDEEIDDLVNSLLGHRPQHPSEPINTSSETLTHINIEPLQQRKEQVVVYTKEVQTTALEYEDGDQFSNEDIESQRRRFLQGDDVSVVADAEKRRSDENVGRQDEPKTRQVTHLDEQHPPETDNQPECDTKYDYLGSEEFARFLDQSTKVVERALNEEFDIMMDYGTTSQNFIPSDTSNSARQILLLSSKMWAKGRVVTGIAFSPKFSELVCVSYGKSDSAAAQPEGLILVWSTHMLSRPEYAFPLDSEATSLKFSPFNGNVFMVGTYSGQVLKYDLQSRDNPVLKSLLSRGGHSHPICGFEVVGTQQSHNGATISSDGSFCAWSMDLLAHPVERMVLHDPLHPRLEELGATALAFPSNDATVFIVGSEDGALYSVQRFERPGAKAGIDESLVYTGHFAPVTGLSFHSIRGHFDFDDLLLSSSLDWTVKLWRISNSASSNDHFRSNDEHGNARVEPLMSFEGTEMVFDVAWSPAKPGVWAAVNHASELEIWDIAVDQEDPICRVVPTLGDGSPSKSPLNKLAWDRHVGNRIATGDLDGNVYIFNVENVVGSKGAAEEWGQLKKLFDSAKLRKGVFEG